MPIVRELAKLGAKDMSVVAHTSVRTLGKFTSAWTKNGYTMEAVGDYSREKMEIALTVSGADREVVSIETEIEAPIGHPVVLGMSPTEAGNSAFVVIVE